jgi:hypothetical protein
MKRDWLYYVMLFWIVWIPGCLQNNAAHQQGQSQHRIIQSIDNGLTIHSPLNTISVYPNNHKEKISRFLSVEHLIILDKKPALGQITKIVERNNNLYLLDGTTAKLYCFNMTGSFLFEFGEKGEANGEVLGIDDFTISPDGEIIFVLDHKGMTIHEIKATNGEFLSKINLHLFTHQIGILDTNHLILFSDFSKWNENVFHNIIHLNQLGDIIYLEFPISDRESKVAFSKAHTLNEKNLFAPLLNDTIYQITSKGSIPKYLIDFGHLKLDYNRFNSRELRQMNLFCDQYATRTDHIHETESALFFTYCYKKGFYQFFDKSKGISYSVATDLIEDDIFGECLSIKPAGTNENGNFFIHTLDPFLVHDQIDFVKKQNPAESFNKWLKNYPLLEIIHSQTNENDNPILVFTQFKRKE